MSESPVKNGSVPVNTIGMSSEEWVTYVWVYKTIERFKGDGFVSVPTFKG